MVWSCDCGLNHRALLPKSKNASITHWEHMQFTGLKWSGGNMKYIFSMREWGVILSEEQLEIFCVRLHHDNSFVNDRQRLFLWSVCAIDALPSTVVKTLAVLCVLGLVWGNNCPFLRDLSCCPTWYPVSLSSLIQEKNWCGGRAARSQ